MPRVFISYRHGDASGSAGRLADRLRVEFGPDLVFMDVDTLQPGDDFVDAIERRLQQCDVLLAVIGPRWLLAVDEENRRRLDQESDYVRLEIQTAMEQQVRIIPVLVEQGRIPKREELPVSLQPLVRRQVIELSETRWAYDMGRLVQALQHLGRSTPQTEPPGPASPSPAPEQTPVHFGSAVLSGSDSSDKAAPFAQRYSIATPKVAINQRLLTTIGNQWLPDTLIVSANNRHFAFLEWKGLFSRVWMVNYDGVRGKEYKNITKRLAFNADGSRLAYGVESSGRWAVASGGQEYGAVEVIRPPGPIFSPNGQHLAYFGRRNGKDIVLVDGEEGRPYDGIMEGGPIFSSDSQHLAYGATVNDKWMVVADGQETARYDSIERSGFGWTSTGRFAFIAKSDRKFKVVVDGREGKAYDKVGCLAFSPNGDRIAYAALQGAKWTAVIDGEEYGSHDDFSTFGMIFSSDSRRLAYAVINNARWTVICDGQPGTSYDMLLEPGMIFSCNGQRLAYGVVVNGKRLVVADGQEGKPYENLLKQPILFSPNDRRIAYGALIEGKWRAVVDGNEEYTCDGIGSGGFLFSPDSAHLGYLARSNGKWSAVHDGRESLRYDGCSSLVFGPDSRYLAYAAQVGSEWMVVVNGRETAISDGLLRNSSILFQSPDTVSLLTLKKGELYATTLHIS